MKIVDKINNSHKKIEDELNASPGQPSPIADALGKVAVEAIGDGLKSSKWAQYMINFASNKAQLRRLCGDDELFMKNEWSKHALVYIAGNSVCTSDTHRIADSKGNHGTLRFMTQDMIDGLDSDLDSTTNWD